jgi:hypothetical protein
MCMDTIYLHTCALNRLTDDPALERIAARQYPGCSVR